MDHRSKRRLMNQVCARHSISPVHRVHWHIPEGLVAPCSTTGLALAVISQLGAQLLPRKLADSYQQRLWSPVSSSDSV